MRAIAYEITRYIEVRINPANTFHSEDRWYVYDTANKTYLTPLGLWSCTGPKFFTSPQAAKRFFNRTTPGRSS